MKLEIADLEEKIDNQLWAKESKKVSTPNNSHVFRDSLVKIWHSMSRRISPLISSITSPVEAYCGKHSRKNNNLATYGDTINEQGRIKAWQELKDERNKPRVASLSLAGLKVKKGNSNWKRTIPKVMSELYKYIITLTRVIIASKWKTEVSIAVEDWKNKLAEYPTMVLLVYGLAFMVILPVVVGSWWYRSIRYSGDQILIRTTQIYTYFVYKTRNMDMKNYFRAACSELGSQMMMDPVLFNIFMNDLDEEVQGICIKFADDTKLGGIVNIVEDRNNIQSHLDSVEHWAENSRMMFNRDKCQVLHLAK
ncbi:hypothetical protein EYD10_00684 [Varanus komodoensis]|nr:hypothetical protein EYD10_00684 [Varanus komodoensis]